MTDDSPEERKQELISRLGNGFGETFFWVSNDLFQLRMRWKTYRTFFGTNKERFDFIFDISSHVANTLETTLWDATLLGLRRITDNANGNRRNRQSITIKSLPTFVIDCEQNKEIRRLVNVAEKSARFARNWTDKKIAHSDFEYRSGRLQLESASRAKVEEAIDRVADVIKWVGRTQLDSTISTHLLPPTEDEVHFLKHLYEGKLAIARKEACSRKFSNEGKFRERDELYLYPEWLSYSSDDRMKF